MEITLKASDLQRDKYKYSGRAKDDNPNNKGNSDSVRVHKGEIYEVLHFIESLMNKLGLTSPKYIHLIEDELHHPDLSDVVMRDDLEKEIVARLSLPSVTEHNKVFLKTAREILDQFDKK